MGISNQITRVFGGHELEDSSAIKEPDVINDRTYESMRMVQFIGYSRNPRAHTPLAGYNIIPYGNVLHNQMIRNMQNQEQQENMMLAGYATSARALSTPKSTPVKPMEIPKYYLNNQTNAAKNGFMNKSDKILIKNDISMPYAGSIIMAFYHVLPIRNVFLQHVCFDEHCLTCQIGFLYRVLSDKQTHYDSLDQPKTCPTVSIALVTQSLKTIKEANQIERVRTGKDGSSKFCEVAQKFIHFLVSHLQKEQDEFNSHRENIAETLGTFLKMDHEDNSRCLSCYSDSSDISSRTSSVIMKLIYPQQVGIHLEEKTTSLSFCHLIEQSILRKGQPAVGTCNHCDVFAEASMTRRVRQLPPVLLIDTDISNPEAQSFWRSQLKQIERKPNPLLAHGAFESRSPGRKPCRYGVDCRTINCHFHHPENDTYLSPTTGSPALRTTQSLPDLREWSHYLAPVIYVSCNKGLCTVSETYTGETNTVVYHLKSAVMSIGSPTADAHEEEDLIPTHLVTLVCTGARGGTPSEHLKNWVILNNETGAKIDEHKALNLDMRWKRPVMLTYVQIEHPAIKNLTEKRATIPKEVFWCGGNLATGDNSEVAKINIQNIPGEGDLVAFDAEFIQKGTCEDDKEQRAARVSCIDANGRILIDDYIQIANSNVYDYLTKFSGIVDEDLDPLKTTRYLTTQKYTYMKILCLVEQKVTFVGHGLDNDWTTLKLFPPPSQTRDTVYMFYQPSRLLSLSFLAWYFFGERIQQNEHCSVEDARMALRLYRHYTELDEKNQIAETIKTVYESAAKTNYKVPGDGSSPPPPEI
ncbi:hypothetical protein L596_018960 [Steinernema carpocapsae]|uniref:USP domain-containing protein n=1 Tax=Steinernema carpocapsae TaxID=34508 RepID=A0A4U5N6F0_STECR|nr:hypothetical protein L596_018960 [Steinernema carpocapsae]